MKTDFCIVIPCYNEGKNFMWDSYCNFLTENPEVRILFVNDGSSDDTLEVLEKLHIEFSEQVRVLDLQKNVGKAEAVRKGMLEAKLYNEVNYFAYLDADLATSLEECNEIRLTCTPKYEFVFASRILRVGSTIERKFSRFFIGRIIATLISRVLNLKVYDTQCGCKVITRDLSEEIFDEAFISKWLFDVELFFRVFKARGKENFSKIGFEYPLKEWIDRGDSKVKTSYAFKVFIDLYKIRNKYR